MKVHHILTLFLSVMLNVITGCTLLDPSYESNKTVVNTDSIRVEAERCRREGKKMRENTDFARALDLQSRALRLSLDLNDSTLIIQDYNQLGTTFRRLGRMEQAMNYHYLALGYAEARNDTTVQGIKDLVVSLNGLGNVHSTLGNEVMAERYFRRALEGEKHINSALGLAINYANIGSIKERKMELDSALWYYNQSMTANIEAKSDMGVALCHVHYGDIHEKRHELTKAEQEFRIAAKMLEDNSDKYHALEPLLALGNNLRLQHRYDESLYYLQRSLKIAQELDSYQKLERATSIIARVHEECGNVDQALSYYKQTTAWGDSVRASENNRTIRDLVINYEQQNTKREMELIRQTSEANERMHWTIFWVELALLLAALVTAALMFYAYHTRKERINAITRLESMRDTFFRNLTHEFRTPLTVILGLSEQLRNDELPAKQRNSFINSIEHQGRTLLELVNQLLALSKMMSGYQQCEWRHGDIVAFLRMTLSSYTEYARLRNIDLKFVSSHEQIEMDFVPEYYEKIMSNLLGNSFKFTPSGCSITVQVTMRENHLLLNVIDTGSGISVDDLPHIFELFYNGQGSRHQGSTGIGLPFVKQMVHQMGGIISARNNEPRGTDMQIVVGMKCNDEQAIVKPWSLNDAYSEMSERNASRLMAMDENNPADTEKAAVDESKPLLMVVEDNPDIVEYMSVLLEGKYRIIKAYDGYDALQKAGLQLPDVIITDLMMPGMDGYELCHNLRQSQVLSDVPIIIVSARSEDKERQKLQGDRADAYMQKPFNPKALEQSIVDLLQKRREQRRQIRMQLADCECNNHADVEIVDNESLLVKLTSVVNNQLLSQGDLQLSTIAEKVGMSRSSLIKKCYEATGLHLSSLVLQIRLQYACKLLMKPELSISEICTTCGFNDVSYFNRVFRINFGVNPTQYRASL